MQPCPTKPTFPLGELREFANSPLRAHQDSVEKEPNVYLNNTNVPSNTIDRKRKVQNIIDLTEDKETKSGEDSQKQLVLFDPYGIGGGAIQPIPEPISCYCPKENTVPEVGQYTVQCAKCLKWRLIPDQEKYEDIREHITERPFVCETARQWRRYGNSCFDPPDIVQDDSKIWAIDKPDIVKTPPMWKRRLRIRSRGSTKFADIYYESPSKKMLRSIPDIEKYLLKHPEYAEQGVAISQFSFQIPQPLQKDYVRKRTSAQAKPMAWAGPEEDTDSDFEA